MLKLFIAICLAGIFQNCDVIRSLTGDPSAAQKSSTGGGDGYDGKTFVLRSEFDGCPDGNTVLSSIIFHGNQAYLNRQNCVDVIPPQPLENASLNLALYDPYFLVYNGRPFAADDPMSNDLTPYIAQFCRGTESIPGSTNQYSVDVALWNYGDRHFIAGRVFWATLDASNNLVHLDDTSDRLDVLSPWVPITSPQISTTTPGGKFDFTVISAADGTTAAASLVTHRADGTSETKQIQNLSCWN